MTVRVNKDSFNLREKLSELERPIGLKGSELMRAETTQEARDFVSAGRKNMIINGDMRISQRYSSAQSIPSGSQPYFIDRFSNRNNNDGSASVSHSAEAPNGFYRSMRIEVTSADTSLASNQYLRFQQYIEGHNIFCDWGVGNTDDVTLSFWVRSSLPGIYSASLEDGDALPLHIKEYQIDNADTWEYKTLTFPPPPTGTFRTAGTGVGMRLTMVQSSGTQNQSSPNNWKTGSYYHASTRQVDFTKQTGNFYITGIQLEVGKNATDFEYRSYGEELALCQRYFYKFRLANQEMIYNESSAANQKWHQFYIGHPMRANPAVDVTDLTTGGSIGGLSGTFTGFGPQTPGDTPGRISSRVTMSSNGGTARNMYHYDGWNSDYISLSAEL